jgi:hypothetical protein
MLSGMAQWVCTIGHLDIAFSISSLSHFSANLRIGHLALTVYLFGYQLSIDIYINLHLKKYPN